MHDSSENADLIQRRLEHWDNPETRAETNLWLAEDSTARAQLAEQRAIDLALRARTGRDPLHQLVRDRLLAAIKEEAAPKAVRDAILATVNAEAKGPKWLVRRILRDKFWNIRPLWAWPATVGCLVLLLAMSWIFLRPKEKSPTTFAQIQTWSGEAQVESAGRRMALTNAQFLRSDQRLSVGSNGAASVRLTAGASLQAGPDSIISAASEPASEPQGILVERGLVAISIPTGTASENLLIRTPHLRVSEATGRFDLEIDAKLTRLHVVDGQVAVARGLATRSTNIVSGQMVEASLSEAPGSALVARPYTRRVSDWPFQGDSPWNTSVGSRALLGRITAPEWPPPSLSNTVIRRQIIFSDQTDPRRSLISPGENPRQIRYPDWWQPAGTPGEIVCALFMNDGLCCEMTEPVRLASQDIRVRERNSTDLFGSGAGWSFPRPRTIGGSAFGGLIRRGELTFGIRHALALALNSRYLNATGGIDGHRWPGVPIAPETIATFGRKGNLVIGALLVLRPDVDLASLGVGVSGPGFEIARALQDYGAYVIQTTDADVQLVAASDAGLPPNIDAIVTRLVPHLVLVSNNSLRNVGGGGERRRPPAPPIAP